MIAVDEIFNDVIARLRGVPHQAHRDEWERCADDPLYFINTYCYIYDPPSQGWIQFHLWEAQEEVLETVLEHQLVVILKPRQIGLTWLLLAIGLWLLIFHPIQTELLFSKRDDEAVYLASYERLRGMYDRLPGWMKNDRVLVDNDHTWQLANTSVVRAFPTTAGDSYTATYVIVDEADLVPNLDRLLRSVKPTIDAGGKLILLGRVDKGKPNSLFKKIYRGAKAELNEWKDVFLPWYVHPDRDEAWYEAQKRDSLENTGSLDYIKEQYPATDIEALEARSLDKRIPPHWLQRCYVEMQVIPIDDLPEGSPNDIPDLKVWQLPVLPQYKDERMVDPGRRYVASMDCAEGLPTSDDSSTDIVDVETGEQVAHFHGKLTPAVHAAYTIKLCEWYNWAAVMPENNNHGWAAVLWITEHGGRVRLLRGHDGKDGWSSNTKGKLLMYDRVAEAAKEGDMILHHFETLLQLQSIEKSTLRAPEGELDDMADSWAIGMIAKHKKRGVGFA